MDALEQRLEGTCTWVFDRPIVRAWLDSDPGVPRTLWINGHAGFGKTTLCAQLTKYLIRHSSLDSPVAYYFFPTTGNSDASIIVRTWIKQLLHYDYNGLGSIVSTKWQNPRNAIASWAELVETFEAILQVKPHCTLVVDGLDQCSPAESSRLSVEKMLSNLQKIMSRNTRLLIVSRDNPELRSAIMPPSVDRSLVSEFKVLSEDLSQDTATVATHLVQQRLEGRDDKEFQAKLSARMATKCDGQFLWLVLQKRNLNVSYTPQKLLKIIEQTPQKTNELYLRDWASILALEDEQQTRARRLLLWAAFSHRPLSIREAAEAVLIDDDHDDFPVDELPYRIDRRYVEEGMIGDCRSFLKIQKPYTNAPICDWEIHLAHFTVGEFLASQYAQDKGLRQNAKVQKQYEIEQYRELAKSCIRYMHFDCVWKLLSEGQDHYAFLHYATLFWVSHVHSVMQLDDADEPTIDLVREFMSNGSYAWESWRQYYDPMVELSAFDDGSGMFTPPRPGILRRKAG